MKTLFIIPKVTGVSLGLLFLALASTNAIAGPGPQFWQSVGKAKTPAVEAEKPAAVAPQVCAGATVVPVTTMRPALPNGKGPLVAVQTGTKTVCHLCPVTTTVTTNAWPNGRGPLTTTEVTKIGVEHTCTNCAAVTKL